MKVSEIMTMGAATITPEASLGQAIQIMADFKIGSIPVVGADDQLIGVISESDFFRLIDGAAKIDQLLMTAGSQRAEFIENHYVYELISNIAISIDADADVKAALSLMTVHGMRHVPVERGRKIIGMISRSDFLRMVTD
ncbi:MAG: CBS domain-containing protein [Sphingorhabdus sp.]|uniref:CBS domain-containing protein n=1 Tax=Sphingorhabdus sp. TaxID=1902408 RepID=UPI0025F98D38|nr:CBS domain-containing protein [Sphingorhabdus sp.]MCO4092920.1 CBS domain-containing protein [Sphingorhabdus sp.]